MKIRSVTLFVSGDKQDIREHATSLGIMLSANIESMLLSDSVWSIRIALPPVGNQESLAKKASQLADLDAVNYFSIGCVEDTHPTLEEAIDVTRNGVFISINMRSMKSFERIENILRRICEEEPSNGSRISVNIGSTILTPYFPSACNIYGEDGLALSLLYPSLLRKKLLSQFQDILAEVYASTEKVGLKLSESLGIKYYGIDASLSPWMEESVAEIIEFASGVRIPLPGTFSTIREVNDLIENAIQASRVIATGYNEVMLPAAEDNVLKERIASDEIRLRDLVHLTAACVAGVDMVVIPDDTPSSILRGIFRDLFEIASLKNRTLSVRVIFAPAEPGEKIKLGFFGDTPVIQL
ncbi:MAG: DUF711 family protein [Crenarchaeota archaeon]|nr:DUF711 family protein [Thermoproteota archaeon]MDW8033538.1 DUF711 family protein [Nitrososphaerota archaeon]